MNQPLPCRRFICRSSSGDAPFGHCRQSIPSPTRHQRRRRQQRSVRSNGFRSPPACVIVVLLVAIAMATSVRADVGVEVRTDATESTDYDGEPPVQRKPYRSTSGGRIKLKPNRRLLVVTTADEWNETLRIRNQRRGSEEYGIEESSSFATSVPPPETNSSGAPPTLWTRLSPFLKRGLLLAILTAVAIVDRNPSTALASSLSSPGITAGSRWLPSFRFDWAKLRILPGEILPSVSAALMIAWIPSLVMQRAWFELGFLVLSLTSEGNLRNYLWNEVLPAMGGTVRKLFWSEFWKQAWDYLLEPFTSNILVPPTVEENQSWTQWQSDIAKFWSKRVVSRIDKWTASSVKAILQKNVQSSVNGMAEDTWKAVAFAWYPDDKSLSRAKLPTSSEDTARMIEIETNCEDENSDADCEDDDAKAVPGTADDKAEETTAVASSSDGSSEGDASNEDSSDSSSSFGSSKDVSNCDEPRIEEEPRPVLT